MHDESQCERYGGSDDGPVELTAAERAAYAALPRDARAGERDEIAEARTVALLRARGLLWDAREAPPRRRMNAPLLVAAAAAAVALFAGGVIVGQEVERRHSLEALIAMRDHRGPDAAEAAALVQRAGSAYIASLARLQRSAGADSSLAAARGEEAARTALRAAADALARLSPDDPLAIALRDALDRAPLDRPAPAGGMPRAGIVWF
jgi:hypothetical protein